MAPVAVPPQNEFSNHVEVQKAFFKQEAAQLANPFYSPDGGDDGDETYQYAKYKVLSLF